MLYCVRHVSPDVLRLYLCTVLSFDLPAHSVVSLFECVLTAEIDRETESSLQSFACDFDIKTARRPI